MLTYIGVFCANANAYKYAECQYKMVTCVSNSADAGVPVDEAMRCCESLRRAIYTYDACENKLNEAFSSCVKSTNGDEHLIPSCQQFYDIGIQVCLDKAGLFIDKPKPKE
jgi:hypothetical protein